MMDLLTRSMLRFGVLLITVLAVSCAQPGAQDGGLPTSPSPLALGPGASYDASGMWRFVTTDVHGTVIDDPFDATVSQSADGDLSFVDNEGSPVTLHRLGTGVIIPYRISFTSDEGGDCDVRVQGTARLDTRTNTLTVNLQMRELGCSHEHFSAVVTGTKLS